MTDEPMTNEYSDEEFRQHLANAYESLKNTYSETVPEAFTSEFAEKLKERFAKPDPFSTGFKIGTPIAIPKGATDDVIERIKLEIDSQIIILTKARKDREFLAALVREDFRLVVGFLEGLQVDPKRFSANRFEELKRFLLSKVKE
jgi:hypothetical protein